MSTYVLIHGAASDSWYWHRVAPLLEARGQNDEAAQAWQRLLDLTRDQPDDEMAARALRGLAVAAERAGHLDRALRFLREALPRRRDGERGHLLNEIGTREWKRGTFDAALEVFREARDIFERLDQARSAGLMLNSIGACLLKLGRPAEAAQTLEHAIVVHAAAGHSLLEGHALALLGDVALVEGEAVRALAHYETSRAIRERIGDRRGEAWMRLSLARASRASGNEDRAAREAALAHAAAEGLHDAELLASVRSLGTAPSAEDPHPTDPA